MRFATASPCGPGNLSSDHYGIYAASGAGLYITVLQRSNPASRTWTSSTCCFISLSTWPRLILRLYSNCCGRCWGTRFAAGPLVPHAQRSVRAPSRPRKVVPCRTEQRAPGLWPGLWPRRWPGLWPGRWPGLWPGRWPGLWPGRWPGLWPGDVTRALTGALTGTVTGGTWPGLWPGTWTGSGASRCSWVTPVYPQTSARVCSATYCEVCCCCCGAENYTCCFDQLSDVCVCVCVCVSCSDSLLFLLCGSNSQ